MRRTLAFLTMLASPLAFSADLPAVEASECRARGGLPNFFAKAAGTGEVRVAYLGGSITAAPGWRPKTLESFRHAFPAAKFSEINAAIGGTGSDLGVFRLRHDVGSPGTELEFAL